MKILNLSEEVGKLETKLDRLKTETDLEIKRIEHGRNFRGSFISGLGIALALSLATTAGLFAETWVNNFARVEMIKFVSSLLGLLVIFIIFTGVSYKQKD